MEQWKDIEQMPGYQVSTLGRVKRLANGRGQNSKDIIKKLNTKNADGYTVVNYRTPDGRQHTKPVHRLVALAFIPNPANKETVNHIDGDKSNNRVENLEWCSRTEQMNHAYRLGLKKRAKGSANPNAKLSDADIEFIRTHYIPRDRKFGRPALAKMFGVSYVTIENVTKKLTYCQ